MKTHVNGTSDQARVPESAALTHDEAALRVAAQIRETIGTLASMIEVARQMGLEVNFAIGRGPAGTMQVTQCRVARVTEI